MSRFVLVTAALSLGCATSFTARQMEDYRICKAHVARVGADHPTAYHCSNLVAEMDRRLGPANVAYIPPPLSPAEVLRACQRRMLTPASGTIECPAAPGTTAEQIWPVILREVALRGVEMDREHIFVHLRAKGAETPLSLGVTWASEDEFAAATPGSFEGSHHEAAALLDEPTYRTAVETRRYDVCRQFILDPAAAAKNPPLADACARLVEFIDRQREGERLAAAERQAKQEQLAAQQAEESRRRVLGVLEALAAGSKAYNDAILNQPREVKCKSVRLGNYTDTTCREE